MTNLNFYNILNFNFKKGVAMIYMQQEQNPIKKLVIAWDLDGF